MDSSDKALPQFSEYLFWDIDKSKLDYQRDAKYVIPRICSVGSLNDWKELKKFYGDAVIQNIVLNEKYLDNVTLNFLSFYYEISKEQFRCYKFKQLNQGLWPL